MRNKIAFALAFLAVAATAVAAAPASAAATFTAGSTITAGTKLQCVLGGAVNSANLHVGDTFKLLIDDSSQPGLTGAAIHGRITDVAAPAGLTRARIGFILDYLTFRSGTRAAIHAIILNKNVVQSNTAAVHKEQMKFSLPPMPTSKVTPGPVVWQMNFRRDAAPSVTPPPAGNTSGYLYAQKSNETIVIPPGAAVTIQLTHDLTVR
ncbi:MAG: hypothetical protein ABI431_01905 [Candidatus Tumulicola sp.]